MMKMTVILITLLLLQLLILMKQIVVKYPQILTQNWNLYVATNSITPKVEEKATSAWAIVSL
ncbi:hypothetical protein D3C73_901080 [compost metagenome]